MHVGGHRAGPVERNQSRDVVEYVRRERTHERPHGARLELEDAHRVAGLQQLVGLVVVEINVIDVEIDVVGVLDEPEGLVHD